MRVLLLCLAPVISGLVTACGPSTLPDGRTQLEASLGIPASRAGALSPAQLAAILHVQNDSDLNDNDRERRIKAIIRRPITFP